MAESIHDKLKRVRKPRVHITYDVETNGARVQKELPFVMGVLGDYSGDNAKAKKELKDRKFTQIDRDNFNEVMEKIDPTLNLMVDNKLKGDNTQMGVDLQFNSMEDFEPHRVVNQVESLKKMLDTRNKLRDLLTKADRSADLEDILEKVLQNTSSISDLSKDLGLDDDKKGGK